MKIILLGYMASGKSVIAKDLAIKYGVEHIDLDDYIKEKEQLKISEIFNKYGEIKFRLLENKYLVEILALNIDFILSVGGGTPCYANNMELILNKSVSVYLNASIDTLYQRLVKDKEHRPLVKAIKNNDLKEFIAKHLFERNLFYKKANYTISVNDKDVRQISKEIIKLI
jgi:shikimate kinase